MLTDEEIQSVYSEFLDMSGSAMEFARRIERAVLEKVDSQNRDATGRSFQDYAIEHAEYLATSAEQLLMHLNECTNIDDGVIEPDENYSDYTSGLRISIHGFRKRRDRAICHPQPPQPAAIPEGWLEIVEAVAHIGIDFGYGVYELEQEKIDKARAMLSASPKP